MVLKAGKTSALRAIFNLFILPLIDKGGYGVWRAELRQLGDLPQNFLWAFPCHFC